MLQVFSQQTLKKTHVRSVSHTCMRDLYLTNIYRKTRETGLIKRIKKHREQIKRHNIILRQHDDE